MRKKQNRGRQILPIALTVAGSDSGGGAGIQADLKVFAALKVHGTSAITCLTAQNPRRVSAIQPATPEMVLQQMKAVFEELPPRAAKTGMLFSAEIIRTVVTFWKNENRIPLVVDPVMISTSGKALLEESAMEALKNELLPLATLVTPNLSEAEVLLGEKIRTPEDLRSAARKISAQFGCAALLKGGHLPDLDEAIDIFYDGKNELLLSAPFVKNISTHGTGCVYSAAITAQLALGLDLESAVQQAKVFVTNAIANSDRINRHFVLHFSQK